jgi:G3E family GTPase
VKKINTFILTGFLGSGKTTLLNSLLSQVKEKDNIVIENEFGKVNIDKELISEHYDSIHELSNGCICCSGAGELITLISQIGFTGKKPDNLFVECTGIADVNKVSAVFKMADFPDVYDLRPIICVIDVSTINRFINDVFETITQIIGSDCLVLNRQVKLNNTELQSLHKLLNEINPYALIYDQNEITIRDLEKSLIQEQNIIPQLPVQITNPHKIKSILYEIVEPCNEVILRQVFTSIRYFYGDTFYRIKGWVVKDDGGVLEIQFTPGSLSIKTSSFVIDKTQLVFIGKNIERKSIERIMRPCFNQKISMK